ncbi:hypothetical protein AVEN_5242-1 [Araneus ventricosus]|uniref:EMI domain-containing protein n=1 Tax=Araneus ventricosus TaxID=182803 RepID=A0A4Y2S454_ARAVE|nr:hypothetical protein AVEN_5242-1 [Araneus ventricosus]
MCFFLCVCPLVFYREHLGIRAVMVNHFEKTCFLSSSTSKNVMEWAVVFLILMTASAVLALEPSGPNTCTKYETFQVTKRVSFTASYQSRYTTWCFSIPPRCTRYR